MKDHKVWGIVHSGPLTFIGAFCDYPLTEDENDEGYSEEEAIRRIEITMDLKHHIKLEPVMELMAPLQQVSHGGRAGVAKSPLPMPYGFTTGKVKLRVRPDAIMFINEMTEADQRVYRAFIERVLEAETAERASRAGLEIVPNLNGGNRA